MRQEPSSVEIQDPTMKTLGKKSSCLKRSCVSGLGCITLFVIAIIIIVRIAIGPGPKDISGLPGHFPQDMVTLYNQDNTSSVKYISAHQKSRGFEIASFFPKVILAPIFAAYNPLNPEKKIEKTVESGHVVYRKSFTWDDFLELTTTPVLEENDTVVIEWNNLGAQMQFIADFYANEFEKNDFVSTRHTSKPGTIKMTFRKEDIFATLYLEDIDEETKGTDFTVLSVDFPPKQ